MNSIADKLRSKPDFSDSRSRRVILVPHCVLNQNARAAGAAEHPAAVAELVLGLLRRDIGILQMPCPELCAFGLNRTQFQVETEQRTDSGRAFNRNLARNLVGQIRTYMDCGIHVLGILGKNGSPSCGVEETWANGVRPGSGAFIEELAAEITERGIVLEMNGIRDGETEKALAIVDGWLAAIDRRRS